MPTQLPAALTCRRRLSCCLWIAALGSIIGCDSGKSQKPESTPRRTQTASSRQPIASAHTRETEPDQELSPFRFTDIVADSGVNFVHVSGMTTERHFPSANGSGLAIFDYDGDGKMDLYFCSCGYLPWGPKSKGRNGLYRNLGGGSFEDVTDKAGVGFEGFCHGAIAADFDNDGDPDLFLATFHENTFFLNNGDGTFREAGRAAGVAPPAFRGRLVAGGSDDPVITVDAAEGLRWRVAGGEPTDDLTVPVRKGQRLVFRQADPTASRGVDLLIDPAHLVVRSGERPGPEAWLREIPATPPRLSPIEPAVDSAAPPKVMAEYEVLVDLPQSVPFQCIVHRPAWSSGGAAIDYDNDGDLDMYVTNYGWWTLEQHGSRFCGSADRKVRQYCSPKEVVTVKHMLYRNDGLRDGVPHFTDVYDDVFYEQVNDRDTKETRTVKMEQGRSDGHGFGVVAADIDGDGDVDLYVANDQNPAFTFLNRGDGTFLDATELTQAAYDERGNTQSGMGADAEDVDGDGLPELFRTNFSGEYNTLYKNLGTGSGTVLFYDQTASYGLAASAMKWVGWGCGLGDFDNDGWPDAFVTNGHVDDNYHLLGNQNTPYEEPALLYRNVPASDMAAVGRKFKLATHGVGPYFDAGHVGRGAAFGDIDDDGDLDVIVNHKDAAPGILRNDTPAKNRWLRLKLTGTKSNRDSIGARVEITASGRTIVRQRKGGCSMESTSDPRVLVGLGDCEKVEKLVVQWPAPSKGRIELHDVPTNQQLDLVEPEN